MADKQAAARELARREAARRELARRKSSSANDIANVVSGGLLEGIPIAGPYIREGADRLGAGARSLIYGHRLRR